VLDPSCGDKLDGDEDLEEDYRELYILQVKQCAEDSFKEIESIDQELEMLSHMESLRVSESSNQKNSGNSNSSNSNNTSMMMSAWNDSADIIAQRSRGIVPRTTEYQQPYMTNVNNDNSSSSSSNTSYNMSINNSNIYDNNNNNNFDSSFTITTPLCKCGTASIRRTSGQAQSSGREFFVCQHDRTSELNCGFFDWADGNNSSNSNYNSNNINYNVEDDRNLSSIGSSLNKNHTTEIKHRFGHNGFRHGQKECVEAALAGRDVFCLMPTGGGKSVVYQLPAWCCPGLAVVFSPLISLIQDQVDAMHAIGIRYWKEAEVYVYICL
jgi:hypothetical protein